MTVGAVPATCGGRPPGGEPTSLSYLGQVTPVTETVDPVTGDTTYTPGTPIQDQPWLSWATVNDATGRARFETTGAGAAFDTTGAGVTTIDDVQGWVDTNGAAANYGREYTYDTAGRLTWVRDAAATVDAASNEPVATCDTCVYTFDTRGRRVGLATTSHGFRYNRLPDSPQ
ncbi:MAG: hypothetical protein ACRCY9_09720 [Phycicoccus sp.]